MIDPLPSLDRSDPLFRPKVDTFFGTELPAFSTQVEAARVEINSNTAATTAAKNTAVSAAATATDAATAAVSAANFKGLWSSLSGALNKPASVKHNGRFWYLLNNLANVAASEPSGSNPDWTSGTGGVITARISTNTTLVAGVSYTGTVGGITVTAPAGMLDGETLDFMSEATADTFANFGSYTVKGQTPDTPLRIPPLRGFKLTYDGVTLK